MDVYKYVPQAFKRMDGYDAIFEQRKHMESESVREYFEDRNFMQSLLKSDWIICEILNLIHNIVDMHKICKIKHDLNIMHKLNENL